MSALTNAKDFWRHFERVEKTLKECLATQDYEQLNDIVEDLDRRVLEISGCHFFVENLYSEYEMTFDTGPNKTSQYLAAMMVNEAPSSIKRNWIINASLPPLSQKAVQAQVQIKDSVYNISDFYVFWKTVPNSESIEAKVYCPGYSLIDNTEHKKEMSMYLLELALGECAYEAYMSHIDYLDAPEKDTQFCSMVDFYETVMDVVEKNHWKEYRTPMDIYSVYQPIQDIASDSLRKDMKFIFTTHPLLIEETVEHKEDVLTDLAVKDGEFGFIYFNNQFNSKEDAIYRQELSHKLDEAISKLNVAKVIGGAIGKSYSYIDWIVFDKERFLRAFNQLKKQLNVELYYQSLHTDY